MDKFINIKLTEQQGTLLLTFLKSYQVAGIEQARQYVDLYNSIERQAIEYNKNELLEDVKKENGEAQDRDKIKK